MPPGGRLPDLNGKQTRALLNHFARHWQHAPGGGSAIAGQAKDGRPFRSTPTIPAVASVGTSSRAS